MIAAKKVRWWISAERRISDERRTAMVDILLKANADLNTQENVRLQYQNMYSIVHATPYLYITSCYCLAVLPAGYVFFEYSSFVCAMKCML